MYRKHSTLWNTDEDRSSLRKLVHSFSTFNINNKTVQIKPIKTKKYWEKIDSIKLNANNIDSTLERILFSRRSRKDITEQAISKETVSKLFQFSFGVSNQEENFMVYPSPGALYSVTIFTTINTDEFKGWLYRYNPYNHTLEKYLKLSDSKLNEAIITKHLQNFPIKLYFTTDYQLIEEKYGTMSYRLLNQEVGHMAQNASLYTEYLGFNSCIIGGYYEDVFHKYLPQYDLLSVMVVG